MATFDPTQAQKQASHDSLNPPKLVEFMLQGWRAAAHGKTPRVAGSERFAERRRKLSALFPGELLVVPTGHEKVRANDTNYRFRPGSDFYYLTGNLEPDCVLLLVPTPAGHESWLFVEPNPGRSSPTFFTDRMKGELWVGPRLGVEQSRERYQVDRCLGLPELREQLAELCGAHRHRVLRGMDPDVDGLVQAQREADQKLGTALSEQRLLKDSFELRALQRAIDSTRRAFEDVVRELGGLRSEREVEGIFNKRARVEGNDVGYGTIAAAGANATILHWTRNDGAIKKGTLLLLDAGVEGNELYTADVTRTLPIGGRFTPAQREIYSLVLEAQRVAFREVRPGNDFMAPNRAAMVHLAHGLHALGILKAAPEEALADEHQFYKRYSLHNVSHMLGLDVHDCAQARAESYKYGKLEPGMVLTVEPGLYFQKDDLTVPARYRGIGVRIEDDVVVTAKGCRILTDAFPREVADVERWVARAGKRR
ncbi:MAG TPA: aminopeptidase P family protein [Myxococcales bacterium]|nr:aminopeptidase P family protein [Myxococcales bacterium]